VKNRRRFEMFARRRRPGEHKDSGANNRPNAERSQRPRPQTFFQPMSRLVRLSDQLINGLSGEELVAQWSAPSPDLPNYKGPRLLPRAQSNYRFAWPRTSFFTLRLADPRA
jgi:hypothetical protein